MCKAPSQFFRLCPGARRSISLTTDSPLRDYHHEHYNSPGCKRSRRLDRCEHYRKPVSKLYKGMCFPSHEIMRWLNLCTT